MLVDFAPSGKSFQEITEKFLGIFTHRWEWIYAESLTEKGKAAWKTVNRKAWKFAKKRDLPLVLTDEKLLELWKSEKEVVGVGFGKKTKYLMLDIDAESAYHPYRSNELREIRGELEEIGLISGFAVQSSHSGGIHVYYPLPEEVGSYALARTVTDHLVAAGYEVANGKLEIFPNKKALGDKEDPTTWTQYQRHRLPLQEGSVVLDEGYEPDSCMLSVFVKRWEFCASCQDYGQLREALYGKKNYRQFKGVSAGLKEIKAEYRSLLERGFSAAHQTNQILLQLGRQTRILEGLGGVELRDRLMELVKGLPNYEKYCSHKEEIDKRCQDVARWAEKRFSGVGSKGKASEPLPLPGKNNKQKREDAIQRIKRALEELQDIAALCESKTNFLKAIAKQAKSSMSTLMKYWEKLLKPIFVRHYEGKHLKQTVENNSEQIVCNSALGKDYSDLEDKISEEKNACNSLPDKALGNFVQNDNTKDVGRSPKPLVEINLCEQNEITHSSQIPLSEHSEKTQNLQSQNSVKSLIGRLRSLSEKISSAYDEKIGGATKKDISGAYQWERRKIPKWLAEFGLHQKLWHWYGKEVSTEVPPMEWVLANKPPRGTPPEKLELVEVDVPVPI